MDKKSQATRRYRLLLVTFDLTQTVPGDGRYRLADDALTFHGALFRPVKQIRLLVTESTCRAVKKSLEQRIGRNVTILVAPLTSVPAWRIHTPQKQREWRRLVRAIEKYGVEVKYLSGDMDSTI